MKGLLGDTLKSSFNSPYLKGLRQKVFQVWVLMGNIYKQEIHYVSLIPQIHRVKAVTYFI